MAASKARSMHAEHVPAVRENTFRLLLCACVVYDQWRALSPSDVCHSGDAHHAVLDHRVAVRRPVHVVTMAHVMRRPIIMWACAPCSPATKTLQPPRADRCGKNPAADFPYSARTETRATTCFDTATCVSLTQRACVLSLPLASPSLVSPAPRGGLVLRRYSNKFQKDAWGVDIAPIPFWGIYLPFECAVRRDMPPRLEACRLLHMSTFLCTSVLLHS